jgi:probable rRNA maturation factor
VKIEIFNMTRDKYLPKKKLANVVKYILASERKKFDVNVILTGTGKIRNLNRTYRGQDKPTDVISFMPEESEDPPPFKPIGEIYICLPIAKKQALKAGHSLAHELMFLTTHGTLHLCGYTHENDKKYNNMMNRTSKYLERLGY